MLNNQNLKSIIVEATYPDNRPTDIRKVDVEETDHSNALKNTQLIEVDLNGLNMSNAVNLRGFFSDSRHITDLHINEWDVSSVTNMSEMFKFITKIDKIDLSKWDVHSLETAYSMFNESNFIELDLSSWTTNSLKDIRAMFSDMRKVKTINLNGWETRQVESMSSLFSGNIELETISLENWDTSNVVDFSSMFSHNLKLKELDVSTFATNNAESMGGMFMYASSLENLDLSSWNVSKVTNMMSMFSYTDSLRTINLENWNLQSLSTKNNMFKTNTKQPLLIISSDVNITGYDFSDQNRVSIDTFATFDAENGKFADNSTSKIINITPKIVSKSSTINLNSIIDEEPTSNQEGYRYTSWNTESDTSNYEILKGDVALKAVYDNLYSVSFIIDKKSYETKVEYNNLVNLKDIPNVPEKEGYKFDGWIIVGSNKVFNPLKEVIKEDLILEANYTKTKDSNNVTIPNEEENSTLNSNNVATGLDTGMISYVVVFLMSVVLLVIVFRKYTIYKS